MAPIRDLAGRAGETIQTLLRMARLVASGLVAGVLAAAVFCLVAVAAALPGSARPGWVVVGLVLCAVPLGAAVLARWLLAMAGRGAGVAADLARVGTDPAVAGALSGLGGIGPGRRQVLAAGHRLWMLRRAVVDRRAELTDLWTSLLALTRLPMLAAVAAGGSLVLAAVGTVALLVVVLR